MKTYRQNQLRTTSKTATFPAKQTMAMRELAERLRSPGRNWQQAEEGEGNVDNGGDN